jgi:hypothetical protein
MKSVFELIEEHGLTLHGDIEHFAEIIRADGRVYVDPVTGDVGIGTPAAPDLQAELDATNRQVEILSDALAESRREVAALKAVQEPVATVTSESGNPDVTMSWWHEPPLPVGTKLYTTPPAAQRQWVGLTDEEISDLWCEVSNTDFVTADTHVFARAIEAKLKEKNT